MGDFKSSTIDAEYQNEAKQRLDASKEQAAKIKMESDEKESQKKARSDY